MAPKKAKATTNSSIDIWLQTTASALSPARPVTVPDRLSVSLSPTSLDDLPSLALNKVMRNLEGLDRLRLTLASPSVRRLCKGLKAEPGVLGSLVIEFPAVSSPENSSIIRLTERKLESDAKTHLAFVTSPWLSEFVFARQHLLDFIQRNLRSFDSILFTFSSVFDRPQAFHISASASLFIQNALSLLSRYLFKGRVLISIPDLKHETVPHWSPLLLSLPRGLTVDLHIALCDSSTFPVEFLLENLSNLNSALIESFHGQLPPSAFVRCPSLASLALLDGGPENDIVLPTSLKKLQSLVLSQHYLNLSSTAPSFASFTSLQSLSLRTAKCADLPSLRALERLPLETLSLELLYSDCPLPQARRIYLPSLKRLEMTLILNNDCELSPAQVAARELSCAALDSIAAPLLAHLSLTIIAELPGNPWSYGYPYIIKVPSCPGLISCLSVDIALKAASSNDARLDLGALDFPAFRELQFLRVGSPLALLKPPKVPLTSVSVQEEDPLFKTGSTLEFGSRDFALAGLIKMGIVSSDRQLGSLDRPGPAPAAADSGPGPWPGA